MSWSLTDIKYFLTLVEPAARTKKLARSLPDLKMINMSFAIVPIVNNSNMQYQNHNSRKT